MGNDDQQRTSASSGPPKPPLTPPPPTKTKSVWKKFLDKLARPGSLEVNEKTMEEYRQKIKESHEILKARKETKRKRRDKVKARQKEFIGKVSPNLRSLHGDSSHMIKIKESEIKNLNTDLHSSGSSMMIIHKDMSSTSQAGGASILSEDDSRYLRYLRGNQVGPSHVAAMNVNEELVNKWKEKKKRKKISQLYAGEDVYHHDLSVIWEHDGSKFNAKLDAEIRKKYPVTQAIQMKLDKIREDQFKKSQKKSLRERSKVWDCCVGSFFKTNIGYVFKVTPRYYKMTPVTPAHCRRCKNLLEDTLEPRWTPIGIAFACLFPIVGFLCCIAYREYYCVVCEEIYVYGDYPSKCKPMDRTRRDSNLDVKLKKISINKKH